MLPWLRGRGSCLGETSTLASCTPSLGHRRCTPWQHRGSHSSPCIDEFYEDITTHAASLAADEMKTELYK